MLVVAALLGTVLMAQAADVQIRFEPRVIAQNLETVWALAFAPDGRLFLTERGGRIRVIQHDVLAPAPGVTIPVAESSNERVGAAARPGPS
jgi:glucose/arabinose dehydrogenase